MMPERLKPKSGGVWTLINGELVRKEGRKDVVVTSEPPPPPPPADAQDSDEEEED